MKTLALCLILLSLAPLALCQTNTQDVQDVKIRMIEETLKKNCDKADDLNTRLITVEASIIYIKNAIHDISVDVKKLTEKKDDLSLKDILGYAVLGLLAGGGGMIGSKVKVPIRGAK